jgi:hypothetical protein
MVTQRRKFTSSLGQTAVQALSEINPTDCGQRPEPVSADAGIVAFPVTRAAAITLARGEIRRIHFWKNGWGKGFCAN